jgi:hypothetical protein
MCQKSTKTIYPEEMGYEVICRDCHLKKVLWRCNMKHR